VPSDADSAKIERRPRVLGLDVGSKTIGLAVSDPLGITAQGLQTIRRQNKRLDFSQLAKLIGEYEVAEIVVGYPLRMSGAEGTQAERMQVFAEELRRRFKLPVQPRAARLRNVYQAARRGCGPDGGGADSAKLDGYAGDRTGPLTGWE
jgi:putative holliday junction resolvase